MMVKLVLLLLLLLPEIVIVTDMTMLTLICHA